MLTTSTKKIAILTAGGDCPGLNAVIRAVTRCAACDYGWQVVGFCDGYRGLVGNQTRPLSYDNVSGLLDRGGTVLGTSNRDNPFHFLGEDGQYRDMSGQVLDQLAAAGVEALITVGGDGTQTAAEQFSRLGLPVVGVPKTIDNDLMLTDCTFGFHTAVDTATEALDRLHSTAESHHRIMILEVMGRYAGWIALTAGLAGGADVILLPELEYRLEHVAEAIAARRQRGRTYSIIIVSEGVRHSDGTLSVRQVVESSPDQIRLGGIGLRLADDLEQLTGVEARAMVLGHLQRGGRTIPFDRNLATRFGVAAVRAVAAGDFGRMVALQGQEITTVPLEQVAGRQKLVAPEDPLLLAARSLGVSFGDQPPLSIPC